MKKLILMCHFCGFRIMTRSGASFGLAVEDRGGMGPCPSMHLSVLVG